ncbi:hypothetical protein Vadar_028674 [Vaccinium darrowii]|uniref:Uncharacterized protein n=1 Tax=Vaccinium darrowii TaxID=229202 RepID=A0ACB7XTZ1_9ERIC|nr:hypothetical protein Vadar_028674 [Vaccinium darrowii]
MHEIGNSDPINNKDKNSITDLSIRDGWKAIYKLYYLGTVQHGMDSERLVLAFKWDTVQCTYCLWAPNSLATVSNPWFLPFAYVLIAKYTYSLAEFLWSGGTVLGWWNDQRIWLIKRTTSYLFAFVDTILGLLGFSETSFIVTNKVTDPDVSQRYEQEMMEFRTSFPMFTILATLAMLNLISLVWVTKRVVTGAGVGDFDSMALQYILCGVLVLINLPLYSARFFKNDKGKMPSSITAKSVFLAEKLPSVGPISSSSPAVMALEVLCRSCYVMVRRQILVVKRRILVVGPIAERKRERDAGG